MKTIHGKNNASRNFIVILSLMSFIGLNLGHAQTTLVQSGAVAQDVNSMSDTEVLLQAVELTTPTTANAVPRFGTFYSAQHAPGTRLAWPPLPGNLNSLPVWNLGDDVYLLDDLQVDYFLPVSVRMAGGGMGAMNDSGGPIPGGSGGSTNDYEYSFTRPVYTTNDLWLEITGKTNTTAYLTIHEPWNVTNGVYDLYYTTNLSAPETWSWVLRSFAGLTNLVVNNAKDAQGFYRLGPLNDPIGNDSLGTDFWVAFITADPYIPATRNLWLYISSPVGSSGTVTIPGLGITNTFTVAAGAVTNMAITNAAMLGSNIYNYNNYIYEEAFQSNGIHVVASQPVSVYGLYYEQYVSTAFTAYPTALLGTNYCLMSFPGYSEFGIVATADNTTVTITPSATVNLVGSLWNNPINLQAGQTYQTDSDTFGDDVTGTWIKSDKPIAVFAGASFALVPDEVTHAANPLGQEQLPVETWGTQTLGLSFAGRTNGDCYRVLAAYSNTVVTIIGTVVTIVSEQPQGGPWQVTKTNEVVTVTLQAGQCFQTNLDGPVEFQATRPIQVAHFANGAEFDDIYDPHSGFPEGDPCEILLLPTSHYLLTNIVFSLTNDLPNQVIGDFDENFLNLIVPQSAISSTYVDALAVAATNFVPIGTSGYYGARLSVTNGTHKVTSSGPVGAEVYGFGGCDAYGYFGGVVK